jgi:phenylpropionate dioxygenase-like ring-hydroxylating dioxygenase large terminal subunit
MSPEGSWSTSALTPTDYSDEDVLRRERNALFGPAWQPLGLAEHVAGHHAYICSDVSGRSVLVQNFRGNLRAFENVCSHRQSPLRLCARGIGPLQCPYHGWTYDEDGRVAGITRRRSFGDLPPNVIDELALDSWSVDVLGPLVLISRTAQPSLTEHLGSLTGELTALLARAARCLDVVTLDLACNWKLMLENGLDGYHSPFIHAETLYKHRLEEVARESHGAHSVGRFVAASSTRAIRALSYAYPGAELHGGYTHYFVFPNLYVVDVYGLFVAVTRIEPVDTAHSRLESWVFVTWQGEAGDAGLRDELNARNIAFFRRGYDEDRAICEHVQRALRTTHRRALFGAEEERIPMFHAAWARALGRAQTVPPHSSRSKM